MEEILRHMGYTILTPRIVGPLSATGFPNIKTRAPSTIHASYGLLIGTPWLLRGWELTSKRSRQYKAVARMWYLEAPTKLGLFRGCDFSYGYFLRIPNSPGLTKRFRYGARKTWRDLSISSLAFARQRLFQWLYGMVGMVSILDGTNRCVQRNPWNHIFQGPPSTQNWGCMAPNDGYLGL